MQYLRKAGIVYHLKGVHNMEHFTVLYTNKAQLPYFEYVVMVLHTTYHLVWLVGMSGWTGQ